MHLISVIVPIYKVEEYLRECIDSIINQTYRNLEIILVDDGSPDNCPAICDEYASKDERIVVLHQMNGGLSAARNAGLDVAKGEYICFVDSDDFIHPQYCEILLNGIINANTIACACEVLRYSEGENIHTEVIKISPHIEFYTKNEFLLQQMQHKLEMGVWNRIYNRSVFDKIRFFVGKLHEDIIFAGDLLNLHYDKVAVISLPLYFYRQRLSGIVGSQTANCKCSPDRVYAGRYLYSQARSNDFEYLDQCLCYAMLYPWQFVDKMYVNRMLKQNRQFLDELANFIKNVKHDDSFKNSFSKIIIKRMTLFSKSRFLYRFNTYARLFRLYVFHIFKLDAYKSGHGI